MKKLLIFVLLLAVSTMMGACGSVKHTTAEELVNGLKDAKLSVDKVIVFTEETDRNNLLGKPEQYISKVNFADSNLKQEGTDPNGGSIETFNTKKDLNTRKDYLESVYKTNPMFKEYIFVNGTYLLRLSKDLTGTQMDMYKKAFMKLK